MTNKTEMVSVPRELLERINTQLSEDWDRIDGEWGPSGYTLDQEVVRGEQPVIAELRALLDAPAEDVRAVGEEPVAWRCGGITWSYREDAVNHAERFSLAVEPLYRHPQRPVAPQCSEVTGQCSEHLRTQGRPVVLPERKAVRWDIPEGVARAEEWNACIDEFERLNK